ncbi:hypothetical protein [Latilactobacillus curvatus]|uniref:hypothetical protein n=1 Tax=Latilactobacillus curvatus TaxID=28038 RepID=UPI00345F0FE8
MVNKVDYRDSTPNNFPDDYDPAKVDPRVKLRSDSIKHKQKGVDTREGIYQALEIGSVTANEAKETAIDTASRQDESEKKVQDTSDNVNNVLSEITENSGDSAAPEVVASRKPDGKPTYKTLSERLNAGDKVNDKLTEKTDKLKQNGLMVNQVSNFNKMSVLYEMQQPSGGRGVFQTAQKDPVTGFIYTCEQTDSAGTQTINKYNSDTKELVTSHNLNLEAVVWFEGNSLYHDAVSGDVMFILPYDLIGNWFIYNFDKDEKSAPFKMPGQAKYCIDDTGQYFVNIDSQGNPGSNGYVTGFNIFDLQSVIYGLPKLVNYIPVKDGLVRGSNKIQGFQMVNNVIYIGRGKAAEWYRTTAVDISGAVIGDYVWDENELKNLLGFSNNKFTIESEGMSWTVINGVNVPVLLALIISDSVYYAMVNLNDASGTPISYISGVTIAGLTRQESTGAVKGLSIVTAADGVNLLTQLSQVSEAGTYYFTASEGNEGLAPEMGSATGMAVVRQMDDYRPSRMVVTAVDYRSSFWTNYYENGKWSRWAKSDSRVPLWKGASTLINPVILDKPITPYKMIEVLYQTTGGQVGKAYGARNISINETNNDGKSAAVSIYEAVMTFPTDDSAVITGANVIGIVENSNGNASIKRTDTPAVTIIEIWGVV